MTPSTPSSEASIVSQRPLAVASARVEPSWIVDGVLVALAVAFVAALVHYFARAVAPMTKTVAIDLAVAALPRYALLSLVRVVLSYVLSLIYTVLYGTIAAKNARAERVMIPLLDVLQGIPVLGFLPGVGLALIALFPASNVGIELTCILMIFTAMPWNMAYSYYASLRTIPEEFAEVARVHRFTWWQRFTKLEFPIALNGLVWNSMMSVAGGWFFLLILEVFTLRNFATGANESFVLPGLGSYMAEAYRLGRWDAVGYALATMAVIVVLTDRIFWKPIVAWAEQYRLDAPSEPRRTWIGALVARSHLVAFLRRLRSDAAARAHAVAESAPASEGPRPWIPPRLAQRVGTVVSWAIVLGLAVGTIVLGYRLVVLVSRLTLARWGEIGVGLFLTTVRHFVAVVVGALLMIPPGVVIGSSPRLARRAQPIVQIVASFPAPMFFPLLAVGLVRMFGVGAFEWTCIVLTLFGTQWYILFNVIAGAVSIPEELREAASVYRVRGLARWRALYLPGILPSLMTGLFTAAGGAWNGAIVAEYQELEGQSLSVNGLGAMISVATNTGDYATLAASVVVLVITIVLLNRFFWSPIHHRVEERYTLA